MLLVVPLLLASLSVPWGVYEFVDDSGAPATAAAHQAHSPYSSHSPSTPHAPVDLAEGQTDLPAPCGMAHCVDMIGCTGTGTAVGAHVADLPTWTVAAPSDAPLALAFQTATRTAVPPPPRL